MADLKALSLEGGCDCGKVRYRLTSKPLFVHCCHCTWCQRETGTAFALNAMIETEKVEFLGEVKPIAIKTPSASGTGQLISRCSDCYVAVWSNYGENAHKDRVRFIRVGSLDEPNALGGPDIHIFTSSRQAWVNLDEAKIPVVEEYYDREEHWPKESLERLNSLWERTK